MSPPLITMADCPADKVMLSLAWMRISSVVPLHRDALIGPDLLRIRVRAQAQSTIGRDGFDATQRGCTGWWFDR
jgi:hypothetical protein